MLPRNYKSKNSDDQFNKLIESIEGNSYEEKRKSALETKIQAEDETKRVIGAFEYNPRLPNINNIVRKHHRSMLFKNEDLKEDFQTHPMIAYRQPKNLRSYLCSARLFPNNNKTSQRYPRDDGKGWKKCGKNCAICPYTLPNAKSITGLASKYCHNINEPLSCTSSNIIYYWRCTKPNCKLYPECEYTGKSIRKFSTRMSEHRDYVKSEKISEPSGEHFNLIGHDVSHLKGMAIEKVYSTDPFVLEAREKMYIKKFDTFRKGLNREP